jgi:hypothetical protein
MTTTKVFRAFAPIAACHGRTVRQELAHIGAIRHLAYPFSFRAMTLAGRSEVCHAGLGGNKILDVTTRPPGVDAMAGHP